MRYVIGVHINGLKDAYSEGILAFGYLSVPYVHVPSDSLDGVAVPVFDDHIEAGAYVEYMTRNCPSRQSARYYVLKADTKEFSYEIGQLCVTRRFALDDHTSYPLYLHRIRKK